MKIEKTSGDSVNLLSLSPCHGEGFYIGFLSDTYKPPVKFFCFSRHTCQPCRETMATVDREVIRCGLGDKERWHTYTVKNKKDLDRVRRRLNRNNIKWVRVRMRFYISNDHKEFVKMRSKKALQLILSDLIEPKSVLGFEIKRNLLYKRGFKSHCVSELVYLIGTKNLIDLFGQNEDRAKQIMESYLRRLQPKQASSLNPNLATVKRFSLDKVKEILNTYHSKTREDRVKFLIDNEKILTKIGRGRIKSQL